MEALVGVLGRARVRLILEDLRRWLRPRVIRLRPGTLAEVLARIVRHALGTTALEGEEVTLRLRTILAILALACFGTVLVRLEERERRDAVLDIIDEEDKLLREGDAGPPAAAV